MTVEPCRDANEAILHCQVLYNTKYKPADETGAGSWRKGKRGSAGAEPLLSRGAGSTDGGLGNQEGERGVGDSGDGDVVDVPAGSSGRLVGAERERDPDAPDAVGGRELDAP